MNMRKRIKAYFSLLLFISVASCAVTRSGESTIRTLYNSSDKHTRDSIFIRDSIIVYTKSDTVYKDHWHTLYRDRIQTDTLLITDTLYCEKTIEEPVKCNEDVSAKSVFRFAFLIFLFIVLWKCGLLDVIAKLLKRLVN